MMGEVIDLHPTGDGETAFMQCGCKPEGTDYVVVVITGIRPIVTSLLCPACQTELSVVNGIVEIPA